MSDAGPPDWDHEADEQQEVVRTVHDGSEGHVSASVVEAVATLRGVDPADIDPPLHSVIDTDALDSLFARADDSDLFLVFQFLGSEVTVWGDNRIVVRNSDASDSF